MSSSKAVEITAHFMKANQTLTMEVASYNKTVFSAQWTTHLTNITNFSKKCPYNMTIGVHKNWSKLKRMTTHMLQLNRWLNLIFLSRMPSSHLTKVISQTNMSYRCLNILNISQWINSQKWICNQVNRCIQPNITLVNTCYHPHHRQAQSKNQFPSQKALKHKKCK